MCIPSYIKFYFILLMFGVLASFGGWFIVIGLLLGIAQFYIKCPNCNKPVGETKNGGVSPFRWYKCDKCGQNLMKCDVDEKKP